MRPVTARAAIVAALVGATLLLSAGGASAHASLVRSDPVAGAELAKAPHVARLWFDEEIAAEATSARVVDAAGRPVSGTRLVEGSDPRALAVALPHLPRGSYAVVWRVLAEDDGHATEGALAFSVRAGHPGAVAVQPAAGTPPAGTALRWLRLAALAGAVGALAMAGIVLRTRPLPEGPRDDAARAARGRLLATAAGAAPVAALAGLAEQYVTLRQADPAGPSFLHLVLATRAGQVRLNQELVLVMLALFALHWRAADAAGHRSRASVDSTAALGLGVTAAFLEALASHAASLGQGSTAAVVADALHVLAACLWLGAVPCLLVALGTGTMGFSRRDLARAYRAPFSRLMAGSVLLIVVTGLYGAGREVTTPAALTSSAYGRTLLVKTALLAVVGGFGLLNSARLHERWARRLLSRPMIILEAGVGSLVLVAAALLSNTPPARGPLPTGEPTAGATGTSRSGAVGDMVVSVSASPNRPGLNGFTVLAASNRRPAPAPIGQVRLGLTGAVTGQTVSLHRIGADRYFAAAPVGARLADVEVLVHRAGHTLRLRLPWRLTPGPAPVRPPKGTPLARYTDPLAISLLAAGAGVAVLVARTRRRPAEAGGPS